MFIYVWSLYPFALNGPNGSNAVLCKRKSWSDVELISDDIVNVNNNVHNNADLINVITHWQHYHKDIKLAIILNSIFRHVNLVMYE